MSASFDNRVVLVTGGGTGIGAATGRYLARAGAKVVITGRTEKTLREAASQHAGISYVVADITHPGEVTRTVAEVSLRHGRLDVLVNNAGVAEIAPLAQVDLDHVRRLIEVNLVGLIEITRQALPLLETSKGAIVNVASIVADQPFANMSVYSATKAAVVALTRAWAHELAPIGVRVNAVSPGVVQTPMFAADKLRVPQQMLEQMAPALVAKIPMAKFARPEDIAPVIAFLASSEASYATGAQYAVGGGLEAR
jgi:NAD(P)-dependent dehydrogenase (short-subunit alcohol dehydrogenase family)